MNFDFLDDYLLDGHPPKAEIINRVLKERSQAPGAQAFYRGIEMLGPRTPDLTLVALRLVVAGKTADDAGVTRLRDIVERARSGGPDREQAIAEYRAALA